MRWLAGGLVCVVVGLGGLVAEAAWHADDGWPFAERTLSVVIWDIPSGEELPAEPAAVRDSVRAALPDYAAFLKDREDGVMLFIGSAEGPPDVDAVSRAIGPSLVAPEELGVGVWGESAPDLFSPDRATYDVAWLAAGLLLGALAGWYVIRRLASRHPRQPATGRSTPS